MKPELTLRMLCGRGPAMSSSRANVDMTWSICSLAMRAARASFFFLMGHQSYYYRCEELQIDESWQLIFHRINQSTCQIGSVQLYIQFCFNLIQPDLIEFNQPTDQPIVYVIAYVNVYAWVHMYMYVYMYIYTCICICRCRCICKYILIYIYM